MRNIIALVDQTGKRVVTYEYGRGRFPIERYKDLRQNNPFALPTANRFYKMVEFLSGDPEGFTCIACTGEQVACYDLNEFNRYGVARIPKSLGTKHLAFWTRNRVLVGHYGLGVVCIDAISGEIVWENSESNGLNRLGLDSNRQRVIVMGSKSGVSFLDVNTGNLVENYPNWEAAFCSTDGEWVVGINSWELTIERKKQDAKTIELKSCPILSATFGKNLLFLSDLTGVRCVDLVGGKQLWFWRYSSCHNVSPIAYSHESETLIGIASNVQGTTENAIAVFDPMHGHHKLLLGGPTGSSHCIIANGQMLISNDGNVYSLPGTHIIRRQLFDEVSRNQNERPFVNGSDGGVSLG